MRFTISERKSRFNFYVSFQYINSFVHLVPNGQICPRGCPQAMQKAAGCDQPTALLLILAFGAPLNG